VLDVSVGEQPTEADRALAKDKQKERLRYDVGAVPQTALNTPDEKLFTGRHA
jgi:hypothetical protein